MIPQIIYLTLWFIGLIMISNKHGKQKTDKHNVFESLFHSLIVMSILYFGGFFDPLFN